MLLFQILQECNILYVNCDWTMKRSHKRGRGKTPPPRSVFHDLCLPLRSTQTRADIFRAICLRQSANCLESQKWEPPPYIRLHVVMLSVLIGLYYKWFAAILTEIRLSDMPDRSHDLASSTNQAPCPWRVEHQPQKVKIPSLLASRRLAVIWPWAVRKHQVDSSGLEQCDKLNNLIGLTFKGL